MKTYLKTVIALLLPLVLFNCSLESQYGLPKGESIDKRLIGSWEIEDQKDIKVTVSKEDHFTYKLSTKDEGKTYDFLFYTKKLNGFDFINLVDSGKTPPINTFYGYEFIGDKLIVREVNDEGVTKDFTSSSEVLEFFESNAKEPDFFTDTLIFSRQ